MGIPGRGHIGEYFQRQLSQFSLSPSPLEAPCCRYRSYPNIAIYLLLVFLLLLFGGCAYVFQFGSEELSSIEVDNIERIYVSASCCTFLTVMCCLVIN